MIGLPKSRLFAVASGRIAEFTFAVNVIVSEAALPTVVFPFTAKSPLTVKSSDITKSSVTLRSTALTVVKFAVVPVTVVPVIFVAVALVNNASVPVTVAPDTLVVPTTVAPVIRGDKTLEK